MATRGPKPKPTEIKRRQGNPGNRPLNENEPQPVKGAPDRPAHLDATAIDAWDWLVKQLGEMNILATSDLAIMTLYCDTWSEYVTVRQNVNKYGMILISPKTQMPFINPHMNAEAMLKKQLLQYLGELGLSPSSRSRLHVEPGMEPEGKSRFFKVAG